jgi:hypothetical protein
MTDPTDELTRLLRLYLEEATRRDPEGLTLRLYLEVCRGDTLERRLRITHREGKPLRVFESPLTLRGKGDALRLSKGESSSSRRTTPPS